MVIDDFVVRPLLVEGVAKPRPNQTLPGFQIGLLSASLHVQLVVGGRWFFPHLSPKKWQEKAMATKEWQRNGKGMAKEWQRNGKGMAKELGERSKK
jgi:hypothetical protein